MLYNKIDCFYFVISIKRLSRACGVNSTEGAPIWPGEQRSICGWGKTKENFLIPSQSLKFPQLAIIKQ
jgi:hypothetical protein